MWGEKCWPKFWKLRISGIFREILYICICVYIYMCVCVYILYAYNMRTWMVY